MQMPNMQMPNMQNPMMPWQAGYMPQTNAYGNFANTAYNPQFANMAAPMPQMGMGMPNTYNPFGQAMPMAPTGGYNMMNFNNPAMGMNAGMGMFNNGFYGNNFNPAAAAAAMAMAGGYNMMNFNNANQFGNMDGTEEEYYDDEEDYDEEAEDYKVSAADQAKLSLGGKANSSGIVIPRRKGGATLSLGKKKQEMKQIMGADGKMYNEDGKEIEARREGGAGSPNSEGGTASPVPVKLTR